MSLVTRLRGSREASGLLMALGVVGIATFSLAVPGMGFVWLVAVLGVLVWLTYILMPWMEKNIPYSGRLLTVQWCGFLPMGLMGFVPEMVPAVAMTICSAVANDSSAYYNGRRLKQDRVMGYRPTQESPNKTLGGFVWGYVGGVVGVWMTFGVIALVWPDFRPNTAYTIILAHLLPFVTMRGDLLGSRFKRALEARGFEMEETLGGHGSPIDRSDSPSLGLAFSLTLLGAFALFA